MPNKDTKYLVVDLFAGPGGLGEGFASYKDIKGHYTFKSVASIERDPFAYNTLLLRHFFRSFREDEVPEEYYRYIAGDISKDCLQSKYAAHWKEAYSSALCISLLIVE